MVAVKPRGEFEPFFRLNLEADRHVKKNIELATPTGFEPAISALTVQGFRLFASPDNNLVLPYAHSSKYHVVKQEQHHEVN